MEPETARFAACHRRRKRPDPSQQRSRKETIQRSTNQLQTTASAAKRSCPSSSHARPFTLIIPPKKTFLGGQRATARPAAAAALRVRPCVQRMPGSHHAQPLHPIIRVRLGIGPGHRRSLSGAAPSPSGGSTRGRPLVTAHRSVFSDTQYHTTGLTPGLPRTP